MYKSKFLNKIDESYFEDNRNQILKLVKLSEKYNKSKTDLNNYLHDMLSFARKQKRLDIVDSINKIIDTFDTSFKFELALMDLEKLLRK